MFTTTGFPHRIDFSFDDVLPAGDSGELVFQVKASKDALIVLSQDRSPEEFGVGYEIIIGAFGNTRSGIRRCVKCDFEESYIHK